MAKFGPVSSRSCCLKEVDITVIITLPVTLPRLYQSMSFGGRTRLDLDILKPPWHGRAAGENS